MRVAYEGDVKLFAPLHNFNRIGKALMSVFALIIGDDWPDKVALYVRASQEEFGMAGEVLAWIYFMLVMLSGHIVMMALITALLLKNFESSLNEELKINYSVKDHKKAQLMLIRKKMQAVEESKAPLCSSKAMKDRLKWAKSLFNSSFNGNLAALRREEIEK